MVMVAMRGPSRGYASSPDFLENKKFKKVNKLNVNF
jgi:hypothetical protein